MRHRHAVGQNVRPIRVAAPAGEGGRARTGGRADSGDIRPAPRGRRSVSACVIRRRSKSARRSGVSIGRCASSACHSTSDSGRAAARISATALLPAARSSESGSSPGGRVAKRRLRPGCSNGRARCKRTQGGALAGRVAVEAQHRLGRQAPQFLHLRLGQGGAERRYRGAKPGTVQRDHVHIAFDDDDRRGLVVIAAEIAARRRPGVKHPALLEDRRIGRVEVFRLVDPRLARGSCGRQRR